MSLPQLSRFQDDPNRSPTMLVVLKMAAEKWQHSHSVHEEEEEEEEEEEALSMCDLPGNLINEEERSSIEESRATSNNEDDFVFVPWGGGRFSTETEMCAADDMFFQGQILPLRLSVSSSETGFNKFSRLDSLKASRSMSRSESMDHVSIGWSSFSSRSSSSRRHQSSSNTSTSSAAASARRIPKPKIPDQFFSHPSPKPQIRSSNANPSCNGTRKSSAWDILKRGLVRTPEIKLQDLKVRSSVSRNSSSSSSTTSTSSNSRFQNFSPVGDGNAGRGKMVEKQRKQRALIGGCSCSVVSAAKPFTLKPIIIKCIVNDANNDKSGRVFTEEERLKIKNQTAEKHQTTSRHRTFEWLRRL